MNKNNIENCNIINDEDFTKLFKILTNDISKKTKMNSDDFDFLMKIINKLSDEDINKFFNYLNRIDIPVFKIIINGFLNFANKDKNVIIKKIIKDYFNKNLFYFIYKKLSKIYRNTEIINDSNFLIKFDNLLKVWKLLYNIEDSYCQYNEVLSMTLGPKNENIFFKFDDIKKLGKINEFSIAIIFFPLFILDINKINNEFTFLELYNNDDCKLKFNYNDIINEKNKINCLSEV